MCGGAIQGEMAAGNAIGVLEARQQGTFIGLPKASACELGVEDPTTGSFGWPAYEQRGRDDRV